MKRLLLSAAAGLSMLLSACQPVTVEEIQSATFTICGFVPTSIVVAQFFPTNAYVDSSIQIAASICTAVGALPPMAKRRGKNITVRVVLPSGQVLNVTGHFAKRLPDQLGGIVFDYEF